MTVHIEMRQIRTLEEGPVYRVKNKILYATGIQPEVFVFTVVDEEFSHVAYPYDMENVPVGRDAGAQVGNNFYRASEVTRDYDTILKATEFAVHSRGRVSFLINEYELATEGFEGEDDYIYES